MGAKKLALAKKDVTIFEITVKHQTQFMLTKPRSVT